MVQSLNLGGAQNSQAQSAMRRINRVPIIVIVVLTIAFLGVIFFGLASRGLYFGRNTGPDISSGNPASTYADQIKRGVTDGIIGEPQQQTTFQPTPVDTRKAEEKAKNPFTPQQVQREEQQRNAELESEDVWQARLQREQQEQYLRERQRQRMARLQANNAAYDAPLAIGHSKLGQLVAGNGEDADKSAAPTSAAGASDLYGAALRAGFGGENIDPNAQRSKEDFFNADLKDLGYLPNRVVPQQSPFELKRGSVIPATLIAGINSDLPGCITAQVSQNVYDSATGYRLLIPQGTKLFGRYDSKVSFGQKRVPVV
ncbi:type IV secretion system protein VirB10 [Rhizobium sp. SLBN-94]|jgi:type IV secretory pathway VirB10-like protein|nr:type IV secretion system protein VirB10 [Rhizobium sp. SLBN-94]